MLLLKKIRLSFLNLFTQMLTQYLFDVKIFKIFTRYFNVRLSPKNDILVKIGNMNMFANSFDRLLALYLWKHTGLENFETKLIRRIVKKGMKIVDIGANIGYYTLIFADLVGKSGHVYAFEPEPGNFRLLKKNVEANSFNNVTLVNKAISDKNGKSQLFLCQENKGNHCIYDPGEARMKIEIETMTLDNFFKNKTKPNLIKLDIQGAEFLAVKGMAKLIKRNRDLKIICEFMPSFLKKCHSSPKKFIDLIKNYSFKIKIINGSNNNLSLIDFSSLMKICSGNKYVNLFFEK